MQPFVLETCPDAAPLEVGPFTVSTREEPFILAEIILELLGETNILGTRIYEDLVVKITRRRNGDFDLERKANGNPVGMKRDDEIIRRHGEIGYIVPHLRRLAERAVLDEATYGDTGD